MALQDTPARPGILGELSSFLWRRKAWWLTPLVLMLVLFVGILVLARGSAVAPFVYTLF